VCRRHEAVKSEKSSDVSRYVFKNLIRISLYAIEERRGYRIPISITDYMSVWGHEEFLIFLSKLSYSLSNGDCWHVIDFLAGGKVKLTS
jgi:hypothetical protein